MATGNRLGTVELFAQELGRALEPLVTAAAGEGDVSELLRDAGFDAAAANDLERVVSILETHVVEPAAVLQETVLADDPSIDDIDEVVEAIASVYRGIRKLDDVSVAHPDVSSLGEALLDHLLAAYLDEYHRTLYDLLALSGIVVERDGPGLAEIDLSDLGSLLGGANEIPAEVFDWGQQGTTFMAPAVLYYLKELCWQAGVPASVGEATPDHVAAMTDVTDVSKLDVAGPEDLGPQLTVPVVSYDEGQVRTVLGVKLVALPGDRDALAGLGVVAFGQVGGGKEWQLNGGWTFNVSATGDLDGQAFGARPAPDGDVETTSKSLSSGSAVGEFHAEATLQRSGSASGPKTGKPVVLGAPGDTRVELNSTRLRASVDYDGDLDVGVELPSAAALVVQPSGGFLSTVLPDEIRLDFETTPGWSRLDGFSVGDGPSLATSVPLHLDRGGFGIGDLFVGLGAGGAGGVGGPGGFAAGSGAGSSAGGGLSGIDGLGLGSGVPLRLETSVSPTLSIGPVTATATRIGVTADLSFTPDGTGEFGPLDVDVGFKPPTGIGLSVDAGAVSGGGFMGFDPQSDLYAGTFQLSAASYSVSVTGVLQTELPSGRDGYSLLLLVTGQLPPTPLGFGFTLNGVGGLVGINRDMRKRPIQQAVKTGRLDSVLFPSNVVGNASGIVSDIGRIFPSTSGVFVVGPMAKIGWGVPTLITMDVGVVLTIPRWKIAVLGKLSMVLPDEELALVDLNLAVAGILDIPGQRLSIDASLYDSRIAMFDVSGDMAMRTSWGDESRFVLSVGGFHPKFTPPGSFPSLRRVKANLADTGGNPKLVLTGYLAVTPNTFQVGAGVVLHAEAGPASVHGELSFDALFQFDPFEFVVDFFAKLKFSISWFDLGLEVDGTLSGPEPWRVKGAVTIEVAFISVTAHIDVSIGSAPEKQGLPPAKVMPDLERALGQSGNWDAQRPEGPTLPVSLRDPTTGGGSGSGQGGDSETVLVHPLGSIRLRQTVVPFDVTIEKYGNAKPVNRHFAVTDIAMGGEISLPTAGELREKFAPAKYKRMSDAEKLNSQAFEKLPAGRVVTNDLCYYTGQPEAGASNAEMRRRRRLLAMATLTYESSIIDEAEDNYRLKPADKSGYDPDAELNVHDTHRLANTGAAGVSDARTGGTGKYDNRAETTRDQPDHGVADTKYVVVSSLDLRPVDMSGLQGVDNPVDGTTQLEAREARDAFLARNPDREVTVVATHEARIQNPGGN